MAKIFAETTKEKVNATIEGTAPEILKLYSFLTEKLSEHIPVSLIKLAMEVGLMELENETEGIN